MCMPSVDYNLRNAVQISYCAVQLQDIIQFEYFD